MGTGGTNESVVSSKPYLQGLKVGLEIHQQLGNAHTKNRKLFCACTAQIIESKEDFSFKRSLRAIAGETGAIDAAAAAEQAKEKQYLYHGYNATTCLVEMDEEPPHPLNTEALETSIMVSKAFNSTILPAMQMMRKTVVDGSAVSGFQRTGLLALGGMVPELSYPVRIQTVCVEEDAAKIITRGTSEDVYNLSRLGIPLIEIATEPDITTPEQAQEVAAQIGMVLRSTKRVKRGLGTIRQDLNVSIPCGTRVEIKGAQDLRSIPQIIEYEALRQYMLLEVQHLLTGSSSPVKKAIIATLSSADSVDVTKEFSHSTTGFIKSALAKGDHALLISVPGFAGLFGKELCPNYRLGSELADLARTRGFGGMIHSDEDLAKYGLDSHAQASIRAHCKPPRDTASHDASHHTSHDASHDNSRDASNDASHDAFLILIGNPARIQQTFDELLLPRILQLFEKIPAQVRKANPDCTTSFQRPMPGAARMYPETDIPLVMIDQRLLDKTRAPKLISEQIQDLVRATSISPDHAMQIVKEGLPLEEWIERYATPGSGIDPVFLATAMLTYGKEIASRYKKEIDHIALLEPLLDALAAKKIQKSAVFEILVEIAQGKTSINTINFEKYAGIDRAELVTIVKEELARNPNASPNGIMGNVMSRVRGRADGKTIMDLINKEKGV